MRKVTGLWVSEHPRQPWRQCPYCGVLHDGVTGVNDRAGVTADQGAVLICCECGGLGILDDTLTGGWREPTFNEQAEALADPAILIAVAATRAIIDRK